MQWEGGFDWDGQGRELRSDAKQHPSDGREMWGVFGWNTERVELCVGDEY